MNPSPAVARPGAMFPDFALPALDGTPVQLETFRGRRTQDVLDWLQFINIQCPECGVPA